MVVRHLEAVEEEVVAVDVVEVDVVEVDVVEVDVVEVVDCYQNSLSHEALSLTHNL